MHARITHSSGYFYNHGPKGGQEWFTQGDKVSGKVAEKAVADECAVEIEVTAKAPAKKKAASKKAHTSAPENK